MASLDTRDVVCGPRDNNRKASDVVSLAAIELGLHVQSIELQSGDQESLWLDETNEEALHLTAKIEHLRRKLQLFLILAALSLLAFEDNVLRSLFPKRKKVQ